MRIVNTAVAVALAGSGLLAGGAVALAQPAGEADASAAPKYSATAWHNVNVRICPSTACLPAAGGQILEGTTVGVYCWVHGQTVTDYGYTNDVWLNVGRQDGGTQWSSAIYFAGDEFANLPKEAHCADAPKPPTTTPVPTTTRPAPTTTGIPTTPPRPTVTTTVRPTVTTPPQPTVTTTARPTVTTPPQPTVTTTARPTVTTTSSR
ncbi:hypothetical protein AB0H12_40305 [Actinosynnema sp. NPDC023794]